MNRSLVISVILVAAATWLSVAIVKGIPTNYTDAISPFFTAIPVAGILSYLYQKHLWHCSPIQRFLARTPDLRGAWRVTIRSAWTGQDQASETSEIEGYAQIDQTASSLCVRLFTFDSRSETFGFSITEFENEFRLTIVYENRPRVEDRPRIGTSHQGCAIYRFRGYRPDAMEGEYWTELKNIGEVRIYDRKNIGISSFDAGQIEFENRRSKQPPCGAKQS